LERYYHTGYIFASFRGAALSQLGSKYYVDVVQIGFLFDYLYAKLTGYLHVDFFSGTQILPVSASCAGILRSRRSGTEANILNGSLCL